MSIGGSGSGVGSSGGSSPQCCTDDQLNALLNKGLDGIIGALDKISAALDKKVMDCDKIAEDCLDKIEAAFNKKYQGKQKTAEECRRLAIAGKDGTIEYAITCAGAVYKECSASCSPGEGKKDGDCCTGCGQEKCCCKDAACVPCEEQPKKKFAAWCNTQTHVYAVTPENDPSPGPGFSKVGLEDTEDAAMQSAANACPQGTQLPPTVPPYYIPPEIPSLTSGNCDILQFISGSGQQAWLDKSKAADLSAGLIGGTKQLFATLEQATGFLGPVAAIFGTAEATLSAPFVLATAVKGAVASAAGCSSGNFETAYDIMAALGYVNKMTGVDLSIPFAPYTYVMNSACPNRQLSPNDALSVFMSDRMDYNTLRAHYAIAGYCDSAVQDSVQGARSKPIPSELAMMRLREQIGQEEYHSGMRALGYLDRGQHEQLFRLTEQLPTQSDLIRMMTRDTDDPLAVSTFHMDDEFDAKYGGKLKEWAKHQGVPDEVMKYNWRAHWTIPSPGQLYTFYHRLRNDPKYGGPGKVLDDVKKALVQQDILPYWIDHYLAVSFLPLGRVDIRRAFNNGSLSEAELGPAYEQLGYSDADVARLKKFAISLRNQAAKGHIAIKLWLKLSIDRSAAKARMIADGYPGNVVDDALNDSEIGFASSVFAGSFLAGDLDSAGLTQELSNIGVSAVGIGRILKQLSYKVKSHFAVKDYIAGVTDKANALSLMVTYGVASTVASTILDESDADINRQFVMTCQKGVKGRYLFGELDKQGAVAELVNRGTILQRANKLVDWWDCERGARGKKVTANILCKWFNRGVIDSVEFGQRLEKLGYDRQDADKLVGDCLLAMNIKQIKNAQQQAKQQAAHDLKASRALQRANSQAQTALAKAERARTQAKQTQARREAQIISAAQKHNKVCTCPLIDSLVAVRSNYGRMKTEYGLSPDEALQVVLKAAESYIGPTGIDYDLICNEMAGMVISAGLEPPVDYNTGVVLVNGVTQPS